MSKAHRKALKEKKRVTRSALRRVRYDKFSKAPTDLVAGEMQLRERERLAKEKVEEASLRERAKAIREREELEVSERAAARSFTQPLQRLSGSNLGLFGMMLGLEEI